MSNKVFVWLLATVLLATVLYSQAQQAKTYHVGVPVVGSEHIPQIKGLRDGLREFSILH